MVRTPAPAVTEMAKATGHALGIQVKAGGNRPLQPIVNKFFYWLRASVLETDRGAWWWANRMLASNAPLQEKMALFWHGHFAVNVRGAPNENFAREIMELFTMGVGHYSETEIREAWAKYDSPVDYGIASLDLPKVVALLDAVMPTKMFYVSYSNNAFDTHVFQNDLHQRLLTYTSDAVSAFMLDLERIGRADDVVMLVFSEFGRRVAENVSLGTDHGAANMMFVAARV